MKAKGLAAINSFYDAVEALSKKDLTPCWVGAGIMVWSKEDRRVTFNWERSEDLSHLDEWIKFLQDRKAWNGSQDLDAMRIDQARAVSVWTKFAEHMEELKVPFELQEGWPRAKYFMPQQGFSMNVRLFLNRADGAWKIALDGVPGKYGQLLLNPEKAALLLSQHVE